MLQVSPGYPSEQTLSLTLQHSTGVHQGQAWEGLCLAGAYIWLLLGITTVLQMEENRPENHMFSCHYLLLVHAA
jgi:hypothetical protein